MSTLINKRFRVLDHRDAFREKDMFLGPLGLQTVVGLRVRLVDGKISIIKQQITYSPALMQTIREVMSNVADHALRTKQDNAANTFGFQLAPITRMDVTFDLEDGTIIVKNDGCGFLIEKHEEASQKQGRELYIPELVCHCPWGGSNHTETSQLITSGRNGLGLKLIVANSTLFLLDTVGHNLANERLRYVQCYRDNKVCPPKITPSTDAERTTFLYVPDYKAQFHVDDIPAFAKEFSDFVYAQVAFMACWLGHEIRVTYNGQIIDMHDMRDLADKMVSNATVFTDNLVINEHAWQIVVAVHQPGEIVRFSLINGLIVPKGEHFKLIEKYILEDVTPKVDAIVRKIQGARFTVSSINECFSIFVRATIPGATFGGQIKDSLILNQGTKSKGISFTPGFITGISSRIEEIVKEIIVPKLVSKLDTKKRERCTYDKYEPAEFAGTHSRIRKERCTLFIAEGDSAVGMIRTGVNEISIGGQRGFRVCGVFSLGGVIPNVMKIVTKEPIPGTDKYFYDIPEKLGENNTLKNLIIVLGLDYNKSYKSAEERDELNYTSVVLAVDNDLDGIGNILGLVITFFYFYWPALVDAGFVKIFRTPVIRAIPPKKGMELMEFFSELDFQKWRNATNPKGYKITYYKGLAAHEKNMVLRMFKNFNRYLLTYMPDAEFPELLAVFYGGNTKPRKQQLTTPYENYTEQETESMAQTKKFAGSVHLMREVKAYQLDNLQRKLPHVVDGFVAVRRKIFAGMYDENPSKPKKIFQLAGTIADKLNYHHGDMSINNAITGMAQCFIGGRRIPLLRGFGNFGTRNGNDDGIGKDCGEPRYIAVKLNSEIAFALFPKEDLDILDYRLNEDGERIEPEFYVPVLPPVVLETEILPGSGFKQVRYARDIKDVAHVVFELINQGFKTPISFISRISDYGANIDIPVGMGSNSFLPKISTPLPADLRDYKCQRRTIDEKLYFVGNYTIVQVTPELEIEITELPPQCGVEKHKSYLREKLEEIYAAHCLATKEKRIDGFFELYNRSTATDVRLIVKIASARTFVAILNERKKTREHLVDVVFTPKRTNLREDGIDFIEDLFELYTIMHDALNFIKPVATEVFRDHETKHLMNTTVGVYSSYEEVITYWFLVRKEYYRMRIERETELLRLKILLNEDILRYIAEDTGNRVERKLKQAELVEKGYTHFVRTSVGNCKYMRAHQIRANCIDESNDSFPHIFAITEGDKVIEETTRLRKETEKMKNKLAEYEADTHPFIGATLWQKEIARVLAAYDEGVRTEWMYDDDDKMWLE